MSEEVVANPEYHRLGRKLDWPTRIPFPCEAASVLSGTFPAVPSPWPQRSASTRW